MSAHQPVLVMVEDAHWIDPSTLEMLTLAVQRVQSVRVMLIITYRPEFDPPWKGRPHVTLLALNRLVRRQTAALVERITGGVSLPGELLDLILAKTEGIPLFAEELTKAVIETGIVVRNNGAYELVRPLEDLVIPATLQDSLLARLDRLAPAKEIAQTAACIGREFSHEMIAAVMDRPELELAQALDTLVAAELLFRTSTTVAGYTFKHALVQDAAYQSLLISRRQLRS